MKNNKVILVVTLIVIFFLNCPSERFLSHKNPYSYDPQKAGAEIIGVKDLEVEYLYDYEIISSVSMSINMNKSYIAIDNNIIVYDLSEDKIMSNISNNQFNNIRGISYNKYDQFYYIYDIFEDTTKDGDSFKEITYENILSTKDFYDYNIILKNSCGMCGININYWEKYNKLMIYRYTCYSSLNDSKYYELKYINPNYIFEEYQNEILNENISSWIFAFEEDNILFANYDYKTTSSYWWYESKFVIKNVFSTSTIKEIKINFLGLKIFKPLSVYYENPYIWFIAENYEKWKLQLIKIKVL